MPLWEHDFQISGVFIGESRGKEQAEMFLLQSIFTYESGGKAMNWEWDTGTVSEWLTRERGRKGTHKTLRKFNVYGNKMQTWARESTGERMRKHKKAARNIFMFFENSTLRKSTHFV
jgi:hypothetical protein